MVSIIKLIIFIITFLASIIIAISLGLRLLTKKPWRRKYWYGILLAAIITSGYLYYDLYGRDLKSSQVVNIDPIYHLKLNGDIRTLQDIFKEYDSIISGGINDNGIVSKNGIKERLNYDYRFYESEKNHATVSVRLKLYYNCENAKESFNFISTRSWYEPKLDKLIFGGEENNRYCISYVEELRNDPGGFSLARDEYKSYVVFQKGNLVIHISEITNQEKSTRTSEVIKIIADRMNGL